MTYETIDGGAVPIKAWTRGVPVEESAKEQLRQTASIPIVWPHVAVMPDVHFGIGSTVGSVVPTRGAIVPSCVGVDIGCGMIAQQTELTSSALGDNDRAIFEAISRAVPHGRTDDGGANDRGAWSTPPEAIVAAWANLPGTFEIATRSVRHASRERALRQFGTLGTGNHFIEVCLDEGDRVWIMLHSGSRGIGNQIASHYIAVAKRRAEAEGIALPNRDLAWLPEGTPEFSEYVSAIWWAQWYASENRRAMMRAAAHALMVSIGCTPGHVQGVEVVECHHNCVAGETHFGEFLYVTRKGAVSARAGQLGIIPGSMGTRSFIVRGKGNVESLTSCSHGAGRVMSRGEARRTITAEQHAADTASVVCRKDDGVVDESPRAYKRIEDVMAAQEDLVQVVHTLRQVVCVKG